MRLAEVHDEAKRARASLIRMESEASLARELGEKLPIEFWEAFGNAWTAVRLAERQATLAEERRRRLDADRPLRRK